ncbi:23S rRNA (pseudouridine(1915)-N(3))-methyltransferase RlmH [Thiobacter aerophilum]|uniref:Ribosomal RNA large subunit methyltransferase H n=1 Tax=Thiobacter aerophilum TaxID=3121275 RepID=A0ABV0EFP0_9BURK
MRLAIIAVGTRMPDWVEAGFAEYQKRMPREARIELIEIRPEKRESGRSKEQVLQAEAARIEAALPRGALRVVLDEHGQGLTSRLLAAKLDAWLASGRDVAFLIGGADGLAYEIKRQADLTWSLSPLTLPHGLVRVLVAEALYRAMSIRQGHPYHRP